MAADRSAGESRSKAAGWDAVGLEFWRRGRETARPSPAGVDWFCADLRRGDRCLVVGGTTVDLIRHAANAGLDVTVIDFSERVCSELAAEVADVEVVHADILDPPTLDPMDRVVADTLLNRFDGTEAPRFETAVAGLLRRGGQLRLTVKIGLYPMDERLFRLGRSTATLDRFWDPRTRTIDFARTGALLEEALVPHGTLSREQMLVWYRARGVEKRYERSDLRALLRPPLWRLQLATDPDRTECCRLVAVLEGDRTSE